MCTINSEFDFESFRNLSTHKEKIECMERLLANNFPFHLEAQPDAWILQFCACSCHKVRTKGIYIEDDICSAEGVTPLQVAEVFTKCFGDIIVCEEISYCRSSPHTLIDSLDDTFGIHGDSADPHMVVKLIRALKSLGHDRAVTTTVTE